MMFCHFLITLRECFVQQKEEGITMYPTVDTKMRLNFTQHLTITYTSVRLCKENHQ